MIVKVVSTSYHIDNNTKVWWKFMKNRIRKENLEKRNALSQEEIESKSEIICQKVIHHPVFQEADMVFAYVDAKSEAQTKEIIEYAWKAGKKVAVPKVHGEIMKFYLITSYEDLEPGCFGIREPKEVCKVIEEMPDKSLVIMPGVAFDREGNRIGYGKGYYDKYFSAYPETYKIAIAFEVQVVSKILADEFDVKADCVITER